MKPSWEQEPQGVRGTDLYHARRERANRARGILERDAKYHETIERLTAKQQALGLTPAEQKAGKGLTPQEQQELWHARHYQELGRRYFRKEYADAGSMELLKQQQQRRNAEATAAKQREEQRQAAEAHWKNMNKMWDNLGIPADQRPKKPII